MTSTSLAPALRDEIRKALEKRAKEWMSRLYRHELLVARTVRGMQLEAQDRFDREVLRPILQLVAGRLSTFDLRGNDIILELFPETRQMLREIEMAVMRGAGALRTGFEQQMRALVQHEFDWTRDTVKATLKVPAEVPMNEARALEAITQTPYLGKKTEEWFDDMLTGPTAKNVKAWVQTGVQRGLTTDEIVRGLRGTPEQPGILDQPRNAVATMTRTAATHVQNNSRMDTFRALGVKEWKFVATLDERTSLVCASQDGKVHPVGKGPVPPLHPNCRSVAVPWLGDTPGATRATMDGPVPMDTTFKQWLESQSIGRQNEVLGTTRAEAWRSGKLPFERMVGPDLKPLTVAELRRKDLLPDEDA